MQVIEGKIEITVETGTLNVMKGQVIVIHPRILETINTMEELLLLISNKMDV